MSACEVIAKVYRGSSIESVHYGAAAVVDAEGKLIAAVGDPDFATYSRSSLKPFQVTPTVARGAMEKYSFQERHVALMCGSHSGEERHIKAASEILTAIGCDESDINCGVHEPYIYRMLNEKSPPGKRFNQLHNNCSGKHCGMLTLCRLLDAPTVGYLDFEHPAQVVIQQLIVDITGLPAAKMGVGIDGCSAPNYHMPIKVLAGAFARLAKYAGPDSASSERIALSKTRAVDRKPRR